MEKKKGIKLLVCLYIILSPLGLFSNNDLQLINLEGLINPSSLNIYQNKIYIADGSTIYIYDINKQQIIHRFGKEGSGPKEFKLNRLIHNGGVDITINDNYIVINSIGKVSFFKPEGIFIKEIPTRRSYGRYLKVANKFIGNKTVQDRERNGVEYNTFHLFNDKLTAEKELFRTEIWNENKELNPVSFTQWPLFHSYHNRIYIDSKNNGKIFVFDINGKRINQIKLNCDKVPFNKQDKNRYQTFFNKSHSGYKGFFEMYQRIIKYPKFFPPIRDFQINNDKLYAITFKKRDKKSEVIEYSLKTKKIRKFFLRIAELNPIKIYPYTIYKNRLYQLIENTDTEVWSLKILDINRSLTKK